MSARWSCWAAMIVVVGELGCSSVKGLSRKALGVDSTAGDPDLDGEAFVAGVSTEGRFDRSDASAWAFAWSGSRLSARFSGSTAGIALDDASGKNQFAVLVDGKLRKEKLSTKPGAHAYLLATGLALGDHEVTLHRLTEANLGETRFLGFHFGKGGKLLAPPNPPRRRIEIIGDSISTGYGNEGTDKSCPFTPETENHYLTYGAIAARHLGAALVTTAWSGKGVFTNRGSAVDTVPMPVLWTRTLPERDDSRWMFSAYQPDAVVINLGTNDFAPEVKDYAPFAGAYLGFVREVRSHYPKSMIFCTLGPALNDNWPEGRMALTTARAGVQGAVDALARAGDAKIHFIEFPMQTEANGYGCDWHPSLTTHALMAAQLETELKARLAW